MLLDPTERLLARTEGVLATLLTSQGELPTPLTLKALLARLPAGRFVRADRRHLVNLAQIVRLELLLTGGALAVMRSGPEGTGVPAGGPAAATIAGSGRAAEVL